MTTVLHLLHSTGGGAGRAAMRLHLGLLDAGFESRVLCQEHRGDEPGVFIIEDSATGHSQAKELSERWEKIAATAFRNNRTSISNTVIHLGYPGFDIAQLPLVHEADILHMHWTPRLLSIRGIDNLLRLGKPTLWTQHDRWPSTMGSHFPASETDYAAHGSVTTHLFKAYDLPALLLEDKRRSFDHENLGIICLNEASRAEYEEHSIFTKRCFWTMPNAIDTDVFHPPAEHERQALRRSIGLSENDLVLLLLSQNGLEKRKGHAHMVEALRAGRSFPDLGSVINAERLVVATIGSGESANTFPEIRQLSFGTIDDDASLASALGVCDALVMPSEQESFSLAVLEALSCGLPVLTFEHSGMANENIVSLKNGVLIGGPPSPRKLAEALDLVCGVDIPWSELRRNARATAEQFSTPKVTAQLLEIYADAYGAPVEPAEGYAAKPQGRLPARRIRAIFDPAPSDWLSRQPVEPNILKMFEAASPIIESTPEDLDTRQVGASQNEIPAKSEVASVSNADVAIAPETTIPEQFTISLIEGLSLNDGAKRGNNNQIEICQSENGHAVYGPYIELPPGNLEIEAIITLPPSGLAKLTHRPRAVLEFIYNQDNFLHQFEITPRILRKNRIVINKSINISSEQSATKAGGFEMRLWTTGSCNCTIEVAKLSFFRFVGF